MTEPNSILNFKKTLAELNQFLNNTSNIDKKLHESVLDATLKMERLIHIFEKVPNDYLFEELFISLHPMTHILLERLKLYSSNDLNNESKKSNYNIVCKAIDDINQVFGILNISLLPKTRVLKS